MIVLTISSIQTNRLDLELLLLNLWFTKSWVLFTREVKESLGDPVSIIKIDVDKNQPVANNTK
jgi:hypothetical protein